MVKPLAQAPNLDDIAKFTVSGAGGDVVYKEGDPGKDMFIIQEGKIEIQKPRAAKPLTPTVLGPGDFFGELSLFEDQRRDTTATGVTPYRLLRIDRTTLDQLVQENPDIAVRMLYRLASRLREHEEALRRASEIAAGAMNPIPAAQAMASGVIPPQAAIAKSAVAPPPPADPAPPAAAPAVAPSAVGAAARDEPAAPGESPKDRTRARPAAAQPAAAIRSARLTHAESGAEFELKDTNVIGRFDRATGFTPEVDLSALDTKRTLSRRHASITRDADGWYVSEPKPTGNGTFVNDARVGAGAKIKLSGGDRLRFGLVATVFNET
jgi:Cyclic nucleotide-binding domain/FHA domain